MGTTEIRHLVQPCIFGHSPLNVPRKARALKWLRNLFKSFIGKDKQSHGADDDLDYAIALSQTEDDRIPAGTNQAVANGDELAHADKGSVNSNSNYKPLRDHHNHSQPVRTRICAGCNNQIGCGRFLSCMGALWHPDCFCCYACNQPICEHEFSMFENHAYHKTCYKEVHHPRCNVCYQFIPTNKNGLIEFRAHPYWGQRYCPAHEHDGTPRCCSCERMEPRNVQYVSLGDGRKLCLECLESAIMDCGESQLLYHTIRDYYEGMNMRIEQQIPFLLVERQALNEAMEGEKDGHHHTPETRGLCLSEEQTVSSIVRRPSIGTGNRITNVKTGSQKLCRRCDVTAILVLYGLPRLLTGSILAHELMHGWLRLKGFRFLSPKVEEGICQVLSHMWLESEVMAGSSSNEASGSGVSASSSKKVSKFDPKCKKRLGEFYMHQIATDTSPIYGEGFRTGSKAVLKYGLRRTLDHIRLTGNFPV